MDVESIKMFLFWQVVSSLLPFFCAGKKKPAHCWRRTLKNAYFLSNEATRAWFAAILFACFFPFALVSFVLPRGLNLCASLIEFSLKKYVGSITEKERKRQVRKKIPRALCLDSRDFLLVEL